MEESGGIEPHPISENLVFKTSRGTRATASLSIILKNILACLYYMDIGQERPAYQYLCLTRIAYFSTIVKQ
jgi:hypothetical protein